MGKFKIYNDKTGKFRFFLKTKKNQIIFISDAYNSKSNCISRIMLIKKHALEDSKYERLTSNLGFSYFNLKDSNGQIIGTSERYFSKIERENAISSIKKNASEATVDCLTYML